ncbi:hypothetical protein H8959_012246 [Pygathrix nigripes]
MKDVVIQRKEAGGVYFPHSRHILRRPRRPWSQRGPCLQVRGRGLSQSLQLPVLRRLRNFSSVRVSPLPPAAPACLVRPPVVLTWDPQGALPAKPWPPERRDPLSGRGKMPAVGQGVQAARPQQAPGGCGDSTQKIRLGSKCTS